jgi:putative heme transporter
MTDTSVRATDVEVGSAHPPRGSPGLPPVPRWLARLGRSGWLVAGTVLGAVAAVLACGVLLPVLAPAVVALLLGAVLQPVVAWLVRHRIGRGTAATLGTLVVPVLVVALTVVVLLGLRGESARWEQAARGAGARLRSATGTDPVAPLLDASQRHELLLGLAGLGINGAVALIGFVFGGILALYVLFFLLRDGPRFADVVVARLPVPAPTGRAMLDDAGLRTRRYLVGTTAVAALDAVVITGGAAVLRMPLLLVIALVTFVAAYVPYLGAWLSGAFVMIVALGSGGMDTALWMLLIVLVTQNLLEGVVRPIAFGAALDMHPLAVLAVTALGAVLGGVVGVLVAPPFLAIALSWRRMAGKDSPRTDSGTRGTRSG